MTHSWKIQIQIRHTTLGLGDADIVSIGVIHASNFVVYAKKLKLNQTNIEWIWAVFLQIH
jgi:hypothetical protein